MEKEVPVLKVVKFFAIVTLNKFDWKKEVCGDIFLKVKESGVDIGFVAQRKGPYKMSKIIKNNKVVLKTRDTSMW